LKFSLIAILLVDYSQSKTCFIGMTTLGVAEYDSNPIGSDSDKISMDVFGREA